jgi:hypothetical protein
MSLIVAAPSLTDWMGGIGAVLGIFVTIAIGVYTVRYTAAARKRISATRDPHGNVQVDISNTGKGALEIDGVYFVARGSWTARVLRRLLLRNKLEPILATATPAETQTLGEGQSMTWRIGVPALETWTLPPTLLHPWSDKRRGKVKERQLVLRVHRGQNHSPRYRWFSRVLPIRKIKQVSNTLQAPPRALS